MLLSKFKHIILIIVASSWAMVAQEGAIFVFDAETKKPVEFVHLIFTDLVNGKQFVSTTDEKGRADNLARNKSKTLITFIGYEKLEVEIEPNQTYNFSIKPGAEGLEEVVVTGQYSPVSESNSVFKVKLLTREQIESRGAITLNELLNNQLNIRVSQDNILGSGLEVQGLKGNNIKILIDGVPMSGRLNGNIDLSQINLDNIERVEIIEGPMSVMYGSNALGGTINLITKKAKKNSYSGGAKLYYESVGMYNTDAWANYGNKKNTAKINIGRNFFDGWSPEPTERWQQWKQKEQYFGNAAYQHSFKNLDLGFAVDGLWERIKDKGDRRSEFSNYAFDNWYTTNRWMQTLTADVKNIKNHKLNVIGSYTYYNREKIRYNRDLVNLSQEITQNPGDHDTTRINTVLLKSVLSSGFKGRINYQLGTDFNWENTFGGRIEGTPQIGDYAIFGNVNWYATDWLKIQPGLRWAYNTEYNSPVVPSINFQVKKDANWQVRLSYAHGFRAPSLKELHLVFVDANHKIYGNPNLEPENSKHVHAYFTWNKSITKTQSIKVEPSLFFNRINNMIDLTPYNGLEYTYLNIDQYTTFGGKIEVNYRIHPDFDFKIGYAELAYSSSLQPEEENKFFYSPEFSASFNYWRSEKRFRFNVIYKYNGKVPDFRVGDAGEAVQVTIPAFNLLDVTSSYAFFKNKLTLSAGVKNIFDVSNLDVINGSGGVHASGSFVAGWGRSYFVSLKFNLL